MRSRFPKEIERRLSLRKKPPTQPASTRTVKRASIRNQSSLERGPIQTLPAGPETAGFDPKRSFALAQISCDVRC
jgi:hypothetical protein